MQEANSREQRAIWSMWLAAGIVFVGGLLPLFFGGASSRVSGVVVPYTMGAVLLAVCALLHDQNRILLATIYFVAGLAIVWGLLEMFSLPIRLAALGSCPVAPFPCPSGLPRALSDSENNGLGSAAAFGIIGLFVGFFGLVTRYRRPVLPPFTPPERKIPPVSTPTPGPASPDSRDDPASSPVKTEVGRDYPMNEPKQEPEAIASTQDSVRPDDPEEQSEPELPAPEELPELPPHESTPSTA